jgi:hypothetical protein
MKNVHHQLPHAFPITLWGFPSPEGNILKLGFDLDNIIFHILNKNLKLSKLAFSFAPEVVNQKVLVMG